MVSGRVYRGLIAVNRTAPPERGKLVAAVAVSVVLHALIGLAWWFTPDRGHSNGTRVGTAVDGPDDHDTVFVLCDPPAPRPKPAPPKPTGPAVASPPATLPPSVTRPTTTNAGALTQTGTSQPEAGSLPKNGGPKPLHGRPGPGKSIIYVLDRSSSMASGGLLTRAIQAIKVSLLQLGPDIRFQLVVYNGTGECFGAELVSATPETVRRAAAWLDGRLAEGRSNHVAGLREGLWLRPDMVFLITDADDLEEREVKQIAGLTRDWPQFNVAIVGDRRSADESPLARWVRQLGGTVQFLGR
jgi:von Willebrand factor type A domain